MLIKKVLFKKSDTKTVFTRDFISDEMKYFHFGVWSIKPDRTVYMIKPEMKFIAGVISLQSF